MMEHPDQGTMIFLTDPVGVYADDYKRMLVVLVDGKIRACLPQPLVATAMLEGCHVHYYEQAKLPPRLWPDIQAWYDEQVRYYLNKAFPANLFQREATRFIQ